MPTLAILSFFHFFFAATALNVIFILTDDLGYGDLGWQPFFDEKMKNIETPNLKAMANNGLTLKNFHTASPICSPSRASIMVGLFPWRMGIDFIYAGDLKLDGSIEMDNEQLPLIPNIAMSFRDAGYFTGHVGKWHLGGQSHVDIPNRSNLSCSVPGINQYGFDEYVGMSEGTGSMRYHTHQKANTYHTGSKYLFRNDVPLPPPAQPEILTDRQTDEAIRIIREQTAKKRPFFLNLWYDAPHSPWEAIEPFFTQYKNQFDTLMLRKYASMVSNMDMNVGRLLKVLDDLGIAEDTLVFFTSDNGPENDAGFPGPFKGRKRLLTEGGIRVPAIVQWKGVIAPQSVSDHFLMTTDLFPTLTDAAGIRMPAHIRVDGMSFLPVLRAYPPPPAYTAVAKGGNKLDRRRKSAPVVASTAPSPIKWKGDERTVLWYTHSIGFPRLGAAWSNGFKIVWNDYEGRPSNRMPPTIRLYDLRRDPTESNTILADVLTACTSAAPAGPKVSWEEVHRGKLTEEAYLRTALAVYQHLHVKMHLFRHEAEVDWNRYRQNKPYELMASCHIRTSSEVSSLPWSSATHSFAPEFCGSLVHEQVGRPSCKCTLDECALRWSESTGNGWLEGPIEIGIPAVAPWTGTWAHHLRNVTRWTSYKPLCGTEEETPLRSQPTPDSNGCVSQSDEFRESVLNSSLSVGDQALDNGALNDVELPNDGWALGSALGDDGRRACRQRKLRVKTRGDRFSYLTTADSCVHDAPLYNFALNGMAPTFLAVCEESLRRLDLEPYFVDDTLMLASLHRELLLVDRTSRSALDPQNPLLFEIHNQSTFTNAAVVDPLFFERLRLPLKLSQLLAVPDTESIVSEGAVDRYLEEMWGMVQHLQHRMRSTARYPLDKIVFPVYLHGAWSLAAVSDLRSKQPKFLYYNPMAAPAHKGRPSVLGALLKTMIMKIMARLCQALGTARWQFHWLVNNNRRSNKSESGLQVISLVFSMMRRPEKFAEALTSGQHSLLSEAHVDFIKRDIQHYFTSAGRKQQHIRKQYLKLMSSQRYAPLSAGKILDFNRKTPGIPAKVVKPSSK